MSDDEARNDADDDFPFAPARADAEVRRGILACQPPVCDSVPERDPTRLRVTVLIFPAASAGWFDVRWASKVNPAGRRQNSRGRVARIASPCFSKSTICAFNSSLAS